MRKLNNPIYFSELEVKILKQVQDNLPESLTPYASIAKNAGCTEAEVLCFLQKLASEGIIRRLGAILRHQKAGFEHNGLLAWDVTGLNVQQIDTLGQTLAACPQISHCYLRRPILLNIPFSPFATSTNSGPMPNLTPKPTWAPTPAPNWPYQLFSMLHARSEQDFSQLKSELYQQLKAKVKSLPPPLCLKSLQELKKTSMKYF